MAVAQVAAGSTRIVNVRRTFSYDVLYKQIVPFDARLCRGIPAAWIVGVRTGVTDSILSPKALEGP